MYVGLPDARERIGPMSDTAEAGVKQGQKADREYARPVPGDKPVTVRLSEERLKLLTGLCMLDDSNLAEQLRRAVDEYLLRRRSSPEFPEQLAAARRRHTEALAALEAAE